MEIFAHQWQSLPKDKQVRQSVILLQSIHWLKFQAGPSQRPWVGPNFTIFKKIYIDYEKKNLKKPWAVPSLHSQVGAHHPQLVFATHVLHEVKLAHVVSRKRKKIEKDFILEKRKKKDVLRAEIV